MPFTNPFASQLGDTVMPADGNPDDPSQQQDPQNWESAAPSLQPPPPATPPASRSGFNYDAVGNPYFRQAYAGQIMQQRQQEAVDARNARAAEVQARRDAAEADRQAKAEEAQRIAQANSETLARYLAEGRPHHIDPANKLIVPNQTDDIWHGIKEQRKVNDQLRQQYWQQGREFTYDREDPAHGVIPKQSDEDWQTMLEQKAVQHQINKLNAETIGNPDRATLPDAKRAALEKQLTKDTRSAVDMTLSPALTQQSQETSGGIFGLGASPTDKAAAAKTRLDDLLKRSAGDPNDPESLKKPVSLDEQDMADLQQANPELHARITAAQQSLARDDENRTWHDEQKAKISSLKQRAADPAAWREAQLKTIGELTDPAHAAEHLDRLHADFSHRLADFQQRKQALESEQQAFNDHYDALAQQNEAAVTQGLSPDQIVTTADGKTWHKDLFNQAQQLSRQSQAWQAKRQPDMALLAADEKALTAESDILTTAAKHTTNLQEQQQSAEQERLRLNPSFAPFVDQMSGLANEAKQRQQSLAAYDEGSPERAAAEQALQSDLDAKQTAIMQGMNAKREAGANLYSAVKGNADAPDLETKAHELDLNPTEARYWINNFKAVDFNTGNKEDPVRKELDGTLHVNPSLWTEPAKAKAAIEASDATPAAKKSAIEQLPQLEQEAYKAVVPMLAGKGFGFDDFAIKHHAAVLVPGLVDLKGMPNEAQDRADLLAKSDYQTEADLVKAFMAEAKTPAGWIKTQLQQALGGVLSGTVAMAQQGAAITGAVTSSKSAMDLSSGINADMGALGKASSLMPSGQWTQQLAQGGMSILPAMIGGMGAGIVGRLAITGRLASMEPAAAAALATKVIGRSSLAGSAGAAGLQTFGQTFGEAFDAYKAQGLSESEARAKAWVPAIGSGLSTVIVTALGGREEWGGVESLTASAAGAKAKEAATGFLKGILKGAAGEFTEESIDQLVQGIIAQKTYEPDKSWRDIAEESLQAGLLGAVLGGASHAVQHVDEHAAHVREQERSAALERWRKSPEALAAADAQIEGWTKEGFTPQQVRATQDVARAVVDVAHGNIAALSDGELGLLDLKRENGKIVEDPPESGRAARVTLDEQGNPIIAQGTLDNLAREMPAARALIGMGEVEARHHFQTKAEQAKATEATKNNQPTGGHPNEDLRSQEGQRQGQQGLLSPASPSPNPAPGEPSPGALDRHRALTDTEQLRIEHLTNFLTDREVEPDHARTFATAYVRDQGATEPDTAIAGAKLVRWMHPFGGGVKARKQGNARAAEAVKAWLAGNPAKSEPVSETKAPANPEKTGSVSDRKPRGHALTEDAAYMQARRSALTSLRGANELQTGQLRKTAVKALTSLEQHVARYGSLFPGGVRVATEAKDGGMLNSTGGMWVDRAEGKPTLVVDLPAFLQSHGETADSRAIQAVVEEELIHRVTLQEFKPAQLTAFWDELPPAIQKRVWQGYNASAIRDGTSSAEVPADLSDNHRENLAHEFLRMLVQDSAFRGRVTESLDVDPTFAQKVIDFLKQLAKGLRDLISRAPTEVKASIQAYEAQTNKALQALLKTLPENTPTGSSKAKLQAQVNAGDLGASGRSVLGATTPADEGAAPHPIIKDAVTGSEGVAYTDQNEPINYMWAVVEADGIVTSNHDNGSVNSRYPQEFQPRDRTSAGSQAQVQDIANNSNLDRLSHSNLVSDGAPIIGDDAVVESGNGRVLGLRRGYEQKRDSTEAYKEAVAKRADQFGLDAVKVSKLKRPILVRLRTTPLSTEQRVAFSQAANVSTVAPMREAEVAKKDAKNLTPEILFQFNPDDEGNLLSASNADFIRAFVRDVVPPAERGAAVDAAGNLSQSGVRRLRNALFVSAYGDGPAAAGVLTKLAESTDDSGRNLVSGLTAAAPVFAEQKARMDNGALQPSLDITGDIIAAVAKLSDLKAEGTGVADYLAQDQIPGIGQDMPPVQRAILSFLDANQRSARRLKDTFARYQSAVEGAGDPRQGALFGDATPDKTALWALAATQDDALRTTPKRSIVERLKALFHPSPTTSPDTEQTFSPTTDAQTDKPPTYPVFTVAFHPAEPTLKGDLSPDSSPAETLDSLAKAIQQGSHGAVPPNGWENHAEGLQAGMVGAWARSNGKLIDRADLGQRVRQWIDDGAQLTSGQEHDVYRDAVSNRVIKVTKEGAYGAKGLGNYVNNIRRSNAQLGDDIQIVGVVENKNSGWPHLIISQPFIKGRSATTAEIQHYMGTHGFYRVSDVTYYNPSTGEAISDAREANVMQGVDGLTHPFDVQFFRPNDKLVEMFDNIINANPWGNAIRSMPKRSGHFKNNADTAAMAADEQAAQSAKSSPQGGLDEAEVKQLFPEENRLSNLPVDSAPMRAIRRENPKFDPFEKTVTVWRASIGKELRLNDYVALNRSIAEAHMENLRDRGEDNASISKFTVHPSDLLMANDATEFIYFPSENSPAGSSSGGIVRSAPKRTTVLNGLDATQAAQIYRRLFALQQAGETLTGDQTRLMERAERRLGQQFMFDGVNLGRPTPETTTLTATSKRVDSGPEPWQSVLPLAAAAKRPQTSSDDLTAPDPRTRAPSLIHGPDIDRRTREALTAHNRRRMGQAESAARAVATGGTDTGSLRNASPDAIARQHGIPVIRLPDLGITRDANGVLRPMGPDVQKLAAGSEAQPFLDRQQHVVYKVFTPDPEDGSLGVKLSATLDPAGKWEVRATPSGLHEQLQKLTVLHEIGGLPTEIHGLTPLGQWIVKQPESTHVSASEFPAALAEAIAGIGGARLQDPENPQLDHLSVIWHQGTPWFIGDLHSRNIMRDASGRARIMDALIMPVPTRMLHDLPAVQHAADAARQHAETPLRSAPKRSRITPQQDADYMKAVESGDTKTAQEMVDDAALAQGYDYGPLHHGTGGPSFDVFRPSEQGWYGRGIYFTNSPAFAEEYSWNHDQNPRVLQGYLRMENPYRYDETPVADGAGEANFDLIRNVFPARQAQSILRRMESDGTGYIGSELTNRLQELGHDGIIVKNHLSGASEYIVFDPSQVKSADPVTRDADGNVIPLSQRFDPAQDSILRSAPRRSLVDEAAHEAATSPLNDRPQPTQAQKEAGNYAKGHTTISGLDISIENPAGSTRSGTDADGKPWSVEMQSHYGYIRSVYVPASNKHLTQGTVADAKLSSDAAQTLTTLPLANDARNVVNKLLSGIHAYNASHPEGFTQSSVSNSQADSNGASADTFRQKLLSLLDIPAQNPRSGVNASINQATIDGLAADAHLFGNARNAAAIRSHGFDSLNIQNKTVVQSHMIAAVHDGQIGSAVVQFLPVDVVDMLSPKNPSSGQLSGNQSVLLDRLAIALQDPVMIGRLADAVATNLPVAFAARIAEESTPFLQTMQGSMQNSSTEGTSNLAHGKHGKRKSTEGKDGDHIDALIVPGTPHDYTGPVFIVNQHDPKTGQFDEHKVIIGAGSREQAERTYLANYEPGWKGLGSMVQRPMDVFKRWVAARRRIAPAKGADVSSNASVAPTGRAQPMTEHVDTPSGPVMLGALVRGDKINAPDGTAQEIKAVHPQGKRPVFRVEVGHAKSALFDENHLFVVRLDTPTAPPLLMRLHEIAEAMNHHRAVYVPGLS